MFLNVKTVGNGDIRSVYTGFKVPSASNVMVYINPNITIILHGATRLIKRLIHLG